MKKNSTERVEALRSILCREQLNAFIIPGTDPHLSEYIAPHWKSREWISGFTGSAGIVAVLPHRAGLWTDSRYFLQAAQELADSGIELFKEGIPTTPTLADFLGEQLQPGDVIGIDGSMFSVQQLEQLEEQLRPFSLSIRLCEDPFNEIWTDRPPIPDSPAVIYEMQYAGKSCKEKTALIRAALKEKGADAVFLSALDEIAWTLNLRGCDIHCNPVVISHLLLTQQETICFIAPGKISREVAHYLQEQHVTCRAYYEAAAFLSGFEGDSILIDPRKTNVAICSAIRPQCKIIRGESPVSLLKAIRNKQEIAGVHAAMIRDGVALVKFLRWLDGAVTSGKETELSVDRQLHAFRAAQPLYMGESFDTIAGYGPHGAIVHYSATQDSNATLHPKGFLLLDSGAQYLDGTTDITRTIALGELTEEEKMDYTLVLKGHIALAMAKFPAGTRGAQLDALARIPLWEHGMNYLHGTGHGVGHFLNVHEGPQSIRMNKNPVALQPGMVTSNEPGVYKADKHGVRIENLTLVCKDREGMFGDYLQFETITLCPIDKKGIVNGLLSAAEKEWLNHYHQTVYDKLSPALDDAEKEWLREATAAIA